jgi:hypothetical protein
MLLPGRPWPRDAHSYAQAIDTWLAVRDRRDDALRQAERLAQLLLDDLLAPAGYVRLERRRLSSSAVPCVRWSTAPALRALAGLVLARRPAAAPIGAR